MIGEQTVGAAEHEAARVVEAGLGVRAVARETIGARDDAEACREVGGRGAHRPVVGDEQQGAAAAHPVAHRVALVGGEGRIDLQALGAEVRPRVGDHEHGEAG